METNQRLPRALWPVLRAGTSVFQEAVNFRYFEIKRSLIYHKSCHNTLLTESPQAGSVLKEKKKEGGDGGEGLSSREAKSRARCFGPRRREEAGFETERL